MLTFAFTWAVFLSASAASRVNLLPPFPESPTILIAYVATYSPTIVACLLTFAYEGKNGVKQLISRTFGRRALVERKIWYLPTLLVWPAISGITLLLTVPFGGGLPAPSLFFRPLLIPLFFLVALLSGPMAEEFGWRGYALDRLQARWNALFSSLILGIIWGGWHLPSYLVSGTSQFQNLQKYGMIELVFFFMSIIGTSILFTWVYNNTKGSLLIMILFHTFTNFSLALFPQQLQIGALPIARLVYVILVWIVAIVVLNIWGSHKLMRAQ
ncbi:CPBP family intramembrane metalloprotease [Candidatus Bathyarchaeota archaeon]|nr:CPBP family intramembrane metalloprotease [Candidatus Bathyarchaeota archaeon]